MLKVIYMGQPLKNIYAHATRWEVFKYRFAKLIRKAVIATFILGAGYGVFMTGRITTTPVQVEAIKEVDMTDAKFADKIKGLKNEVANKLSSCESAGYKEDDGIIIFDSNAKASIGQFQFQKSTVIHYYKVLYGKTITPKEAVLIALDESKARELAIDIMFKTKNKAGKDWYNCTEKHGLDAQIDMIKKLEL